MFETLLIPYHEYIPVRHLRLRHAGSTVNRVLIAPDEFRLYVDVSICVFYVMYLQTLSRIVRWLSSTIAHFTF